MSTSDLLPGAVRGWLKPKPKDPPVPAGDVMVIPGAKRGWITQADIDAEKDRPAARPPFAPTPSPVPLPIPPLVAAIHPRESIGRWGAADPSPEALAALVEIRGERVETELVEGVKLLETKIAAECRSALAGAAYDRNNIHIADLVDRRRAYGARLDAVRRLRESEGDPIAEVPSPELAALLAGDPALIRERLADALVEARSELASVDAEIGLIKARAADDRAYLTEVESSTDWAGDVKSSVKATVTKAWMFDEPWLDQTLRRLDGFAWPTPHWPDRGGQDIALASLTDLFGRRAALTEAVAGLEGDRALVDRTVGDRVGKAIESAGGTERVVERITAGFVMGRPDPAIQRLEKEASDIQASIYRCDQMELSNGEHAARLKAQLQAANSAVLSARRTLVASSRGRAKEVVEGATAGAEQSRADLESLAASASNDHPAGFGDAVKSARIDRIILTELAAAMAKAIVNESRTPIGVPTND